MNIVLIVSATERIPNSRAVKGKRSAAQANGNAGEQLKPQLTCADPAHTQVRRAPLRQPVKCLMQPSEDTQKAFYQLPA